MVAYQYWIRLPRVWRVSLHVQRPTEKGSSTTRKPSRVNNGCVTCQPMTFDQDLPDALQAVSGGKDERDAAEFWSGVSLEQLRREKHPENNAEPAPRKMPNGSPRLKTIAKLAESIPRQASTTVVSKRNATARRNCRDTARQRTRDQKRDKETRRTSSRRNPRRSWRRSLSVDLSASARRSQACLASAPA